MLFETASWFTTRLNQSFDDVYGTDDDEDDDEDGGTDSSSSFESNVDIEQYIKTSETLINTLATLIDSYTAVTQNVAT